MPLTIDGAFVVVFVGILVGLRGWSVVFPEDGLIVVRDVGIGKLEDTAVGIPVDAARVALLDG